MKITIKDIENQLETFFEGGLLSVFNKNPLIMLTETLINEIETNILTVDGENIVPVNFTIKIQDKNQFKREELKEWESFAHQLITEFSEDNSYILKRPLKTEIIFDETIDNNFIITAQQSAFISGDTINLSIEVADESEKLNGLNAYLILWNEEFFQINKNIISIGRQENNDLVIDNLRVSRCHAQIRQIKNGFYIFDTDSKSGTIVNGLKINQQQLSNGDVIEIADVPIIFSMGENLYELDHKNTRTKIIKTIGTRKSI